MLKKIKQKILLAKIAGITIVVVFISHLWLTIYQAVQINQLQNTIEEIRS